MLRIVAIVMIVLIVAFSGCLGGDKKPAEVEPTPAATVAPTVAPTPAATVAPAVAPTEVTKKADAGELFTPSIVKDMQPGKIPTGCGELDQRVLRIYDQNGDGLIDATWMQDAAIDIEYLRITNDEYEQVKYAYEQKCPVESKPVESE